ncbi:nuclear transport factor 2 family protein [Cognatishimia sp. SS12]|uniref:nuclear transport factor 2 family protein n=1 Tax=Cognatishimia sp. SS12 TaxID=2979465 RepID=UPI00232CA99F|nr:nuclear transport factor 2 family protein [Cognatishimia sp. SS12]MDC0738650.1 nuclear transport factor 2 family protein [Cognatishimia sp. SS12]
MSFQNAKKVVKTFYSALDTANINEVSGVMDLFHESDARWRGYHPFNEIRDPDQVAERFWVPLKSSLTSLQHRLDIFFAGDNVYPDTGGVWVATMGHLIGLFDKPWLGIPPTGKMAFLRFSAFHRVEGDKIVDTAMYFDIPHLMMQAGLQPFPPQTGAHFVQPGPDSHNGLIFEDRPPHEGQETLAAIDRMVKDLGQWNSGLPLEEELARTWHKDMLWWGPAGIGSTYTIERYAKQHAGPFRGSFKERSKTNHICRIGEGQYGGFFGWPNFTAIPKGGFMGMPASERPGEFRVIDMYRRDGDKLKENWVFIDLLHFWKQQGVDILERTTGIVSHAH